MIDNPSETVASPRLRALFAIAALVVLALWGWSLVPPIQNWGNPAEDGFSYVGAFYATLICLPVGLFLLAGAMAGHGRWVNLARRALLPAAGIILLVAAFLVFQNIADNNDGKVFGIQIGQVEQQNNHSIDMI
jgi:hypothetical protein